MFFVSHSALPLEADTQPGPGPSREDKNKEISVYKMFNLLICLKFVSSDRGACTRVWLRQEGEDEILDDRVLIVCVHVIKTLDELLQSDDEINDRRKHIYVNFVIKKTTHKS